MKLPYLGIWLSGYSSEGKTQTRTCILTYYDTSRAPSLPSSRTEPSMINNIIHHVHWQDIDVHWQDIDVHWQDIDVHWQDIDVHWQDIDVHWQDIDVHWQDIDVHLSVRLISLYLTSIHDILCFCISFIFAVTFASSCQNERHKIC